MLILGLLGMYFDAAVVFVTKSSLLFRLAVAILCKDNKQEFETRAEIKIGGNPNGSICPISNGKKHISQNQFIYILVISGQVEVKEHEMNKYK